MTTICNCTRPADGYLCRRCITQLSDDLTKIAEYWPESEVTLARQHVMPRNGGGNRTKGGAKGENLPFHYGAAGIRFDVENGIKTWLRDVAGDRMPETVDQPVWRGIPWLYPQTIYVSTVQQACEWMRTYATMISNLPQAPQILDDVYRWRGALERLIDRPKDRVVVAHCDLCGKGLSEDPGALSAVCDDCEHVVVVEVQKERRVAAAHEQIVPKTKAVQAVALLYHYRITTKTINRWIERDAIDEYDNGVRVADVLAQVEKLIAKRRARVA